MCKKEFKSVIRAEVRTLPTPGSEKKNCMKKFSHKGTIKFGDVESDCYVLEGGLAVLSKRGAAALLGFVGEGKGGSKLDSFLKAVDKKGYDSKQLQESVGGSNLLFIAPEVGRVTGIEAEVFMRIAVISSRAYLAGDLKKMQEHIGIQCHKIVLASASVGITALIHEAVGYTSADPNELRTIIASSWLVPAPAVRQKTVPDEFYEYLYMVMGWKRLSPPHLHGQAVGRITADIVYSRLAPGVLQEVRTRNPVQANGKRRYTHHQFLKLDTAYNALVRRIEDVTLMLRMAGVGGWSKFYDFLNNAYPVQEDLASVAAIAAPEVVLPQLEEDIENSEVEAASA